MSTLYAFDAGRYAMRCWPEQGGVVYDDADATLYEVSPLACEVLSVLRAQSPASAAQLAEALIGEAPETEDIVLMDSMLAQLVELGVLTKCMAS